MTGKLDRGKRELLGAERQAAGGVEAAAATAVRDDLTAFGLDPRP
jgi:hypothetical protein